MIVVLLALALRFAFAGWIRVPLQGDAGNYVALAQKFVEKGFWGPDSSRPPLYPLCLAIFSRLTRLPVTSQWAHSFLNGIFDTLSILLLFRIAKRLIPEAAIWGIAFVAVSPLWFGHFSSAVTEPISVTLFLAFFDRWTREKRDDFDVVWSGLFMGLLSLTRGVFIAFPFGLLVWELLFRKAPKGAKASLKTAAIFLLAALALPAGWGFRNLESSGKFTMTQDDSTAVIMAWSAIQLPTLDWRVPEDSAFMINHPWSDVILSRANPQRTEEVHKLMRADVIAFIKDRPLTFVLNFFKKLLRLWATGWWSPYSYIYSPMSQAWFYVGICCAPVLVFGALGVFLQWRRSPKAKSARDAAPVGRWRALRLQLYTVLFISAIALPFTVDARYSLPAYVTFGLWMGTGVLGLKRFFLRR